MQGRRKQSGLSSYGWTTFNKFIIIANYYLKDYCTCISNKQNGITVFILSWLSKSSSVRTSFFASLLMAASSLLPSSPSMPSEMPSSSRQNPSALAAEPRAELTGGLRQEYPQVLDAPHQPRLFSFPRCSFGNKIAVKRVQHGSTVIRGYIMIKARFFT